MNLAKISANGQITVPVEIRKAQAAFVDASKAMEITNEGNFQELVDKTRYKKDK